MGMCYYEQISDVGRDQEMTRRSQESFDELIRRFPDSDYSQDAELKVDLIRDHLAGKEMEIGRYYQRREFWLASINRFQTVVEQYQTTTHVPEALHRLTESYLALGHDRGGPGLGRRAGLQFPRQRLVRAVLRAAAGPAARAEGGASGSWLSRVF